jgi:hypothetical protein
VRDHHTQDVWLLASFPYLKALKGLTTHIFPLFKGGVQLFTFSVSKYKQKVLNKKIGQPLN